MKTLKTLLFIFLVTNFTYSYGQDAPLYLPLSFASPRLDSTIASLEKSNKKELSSLPKQYNEEYIKIYKSRNEELISELKEGHFIFEKSVNTYFDNIFREICRANSSIPAQNIRLLINRVAVPNAYCVGEGTIVINLALIKHLENESQIAFVLCHELAHYTLNHVNNAIASRITKLNSKEMRKEVKTILKSEIRQVSRLRELLKGVFYERGKHSRLNETSADSLALVYLKNTNYDAKEALKTLAILDRIDEQDTENQLDLKKTFNSTQYPFKKSWLETGSSLNINQQVEDKKEIYNQDSLKTHPDCQKRITILKKYLKEGEELNKKVFLQAQETFKELCVKSEFEMVESAFFFESYDLCLYQSLLLSNKYPNDIYLKATIGKCYAKMYEALKNHELNKYVALPSSKEKNKDFQQLLYFINNLRLREIASVGYYYLLNEKDKYLKSEDYVYALYALSQALALSEEQKSFKELYFKLFPLGKYTHQIK